MDSTTHSVLLKIPSEVLDLILGFLETRDLLNLHKSGDNAFSKHFHRSLKEIQIVNDTGRLLSFPSMICSFLAMRSLLVEVTSIPSQGRIDNIDLSRIPRSLQRLELHIVDSLKKLQFSSPGTMRTADGVKEILPNLKALLVSHPGHSSWIPAEVTAAADFVKSALLVGLPLLNTLHIQGICLPAPTYRELNSNLKDLSVHISIWEDQEETQIRKLLFPRAPLPSTPQSHPLKEVVSQHTKDFFSNLPRELESLSVVGFFSLTESISEIPSKSLTKLSLNPDTWHAKNLHSEISVILDSIPTTNGNTSMIEYLEISMSRELAPEIATKISEKFVCLKTLTVVGSPVSWEAMEFLPRTITAIYWPLSHGIAHIRSQTDISKWPPKLVSLPALYTAPPKKLRKLPSTLRNTSLTVPASDQLHTLPPALTFLNLTGAIQAPDLMTLPCYLSLTSILFGLVFPLSEDHLVAIARCRNLKQISIFGILDSAEHLKHLKNCTKLQSLSINSHSMVPRRREVLESCGVDFGSHLLSVADFSLPWASSLQRLSISSKYGTVDPITGQKCGEYESETWEPILSFWVSRIPSNLTSLDLHHTIIPTSALEKLPSSLTRLIYGSTEKTFSIRQMLVMPQNIQYITAYISTDNTNPYEDFKPDGPTVFVTSVEELKLCLPRYLQHLKIASFGLTNKVHIALSDPPTSDLTSLLSPLWTPGRFGLKLSFLGSHPSPSDDPSNPSENIATAFSVAILSIRHKMWPQS